MIHTLTCPVCGEGFARVFEHPPNGDLLCHLWKHLLVSKKFTREDHVWHVCWCGGESGFDGWVKHMEGKDPQTHYLEHALGIDKSLYERLVEDADKMTWKFK